MLNLIVLMGRLTADPEMRTTPSGISCARFTLAVERNYTDKQTGTRQADFIDVVAWRSTADFVSRYFHKGQLITTQGSLQTHAYDDKDGNRRKAFEVVTDNVYFAEPKRSNENGGDYSSGYNTGYNNNYSAPASPSTPPVKTEEPASFSTGNDSDFVSVPDDDLPF